MTRRVQFPRSSVSGKIPDSVQAGSFAVNWTDLKLYTGDAGGTPILMSQITTDFDATKVYRRGDFVIESDDLWRARQDVPANVGFRESEWLRLSFGSGVDSGMRGETGSISGGAVSWDGSLNLNVASGQGLVVDWTDAANPVVTVFSWGDFVITVPDGVAGTFSLYIDPDGAYFTKTTGSPWSTAVRLSKVILSTSPRAVMGVLDARIYAGRSANTAKDLNAPMSIGDGLLVSGHTNLAISRTAGSILGIGVSDDQSEPNKAEIASAAVVSYLPVRAGHIGDTFLTAVEPDVYDAGGSFATIPAGSATIHILKMTQDGTHFIEYGQTLFDGVTAAANGLFDYIEGGQYVAMLDADISVTLAALIVTPEAVEWAAPYARVVRSYTKSRTFLPSDENSEESYYLLDGSRALSGDMNAAGYAITETDIDAERGVILRPKSDSTGAMEDREIAVDGANRKVFWSDGTGNPQPIADRTEVYDGTRTYEVGDTCFESNIMYRCLTQTSGAFAPLSWQVIGASGGSTAGAVILQPTTVDRNEIDLTGNPSASGLTITGDESQTEVLARLGDGVIDRYGVPSGAFGSVVFRVSDTHPFSVVGQVAAFDPDSSAWVLADAGNPALAGRALAVIHDRVDGTQVNLQTCGTITGLSSGAFEGGVPPVAGQVYYASATNAGLLTPTAPAVPNRVDPVMVAISDTAAVLIIGQDLDVGSVTSGGTSITITQAAHGFTSANVGAPLALAAGGWEFAISDAIATASIGLLQEVVDASTFVLNMAGYIGGVDASVFEGSVPPTAGNLYYTSQTEAGKLTETVPSGSELRNAVFLAMGPTDGIALPYEAEEAAVTRKGDTMTGDLFMDDAMVSISREGDHFHSANADGSLQVGAITYSSVDGTWGLKPMDVAGDEAGVNLLYHQEDATWQIGGSDIVTKSTTGAFVPLDGSEAAIGPIASEDALISGLGQGGASLSLDAVDFNYLDSTPEIDGNAAQIGMNTASTDEAAMTFSVMSGVLAGVAADKNVVMTMTPSGIVASYPYRAPAGAVDTPSLGFGGGTGFWKDDDIVALSVAGEKRLSLNTTGQTGLLITPDDGEAAFLRIGTERVAAGDSSIELNSGDGYANGTQLIRSAADHSTQLIHRGDGNMSISSTGAGAILFYRGGALTARVDAAGVDVVGDLTLITKEKGDNLYTAGTKDPHGPIILTGGGPITYAHGLGYTPSSWKVVLRCVVANAGYVVGDTIDVTSHNEGSGSRGNTSWANDTQVGLSGTFSFYVANKTTGLLVALDNASWRAYFIVTESDMGI